MNYELMLKVFQYIGVSVIISSLLWLLGEAVSKIANVSTKSIIRYGKVIERFTALLYLLLFLYAMVMCTLVLTNIQ